MGFFEALLRMPIANYSAYREFEFSQRKFAYGIRWNAKNILPLLDAKKVPCHSPCSAYTVCLCRENTASVVYTISVALSNTGLTTVIRLAGLRSGCAFTGVTA